MQNVSSHRPLLNGIRISGCYAYLNARDVRVEMTVVHPGLNRRWHEMVIARGAACPAETLKAALDQLELEIREAGAHAIEPDAQGLREITAVMDDLRVARRSARRAA